MAVVPVQKTAVPFPQEVDTEQGAQWVFTPSHFTKGPDASVPDLQSPLTLVQEMVELNGPQSFVTVHDVFQRAPAGAASGAGVGAGATGVKIAARSASRDVDVVDGSAAAARSEVVKVRRIASSNVFFMTSP